MKEKTTLPELYDMLDAVLHFWYKGSEKIRNPFPGLPMATLRDESRNRIRSWYEKLSETAKDDLSREELLERIEEHLFEQAYKLADNDEQRITIKYPLMLRPDDTVRHEGHPESRVTRRRIIVENNASFLEVECETLGDRQSWQTRFELFE